MILYTFVFEFELDYWTGRITNLSKFKFKHLVTSDDFEAFNNNSILKPGPAIAEISDLANSNMADASV